MSDGPHRTLPMSRSWKRTARSADNGNFPIQDVISTLSCALVDDFRKEVPADVVRLLRVHFQGGKGELFADQQQHDWANLQRLADGYGMARHLLDNAAQEIRAGNIGEGGLANTIKTTLFERSLAARRDVQEHYQRESSSARTANVRDRMTEAIQKASFDAMASYAMQDKAFPRPKSNQSGGLDEGVAI